jgi:hypothetical protein
VSLKDPNAWTVDSAMYCGAELATFGHTLADNPFPDSPGWYVFRRAWEYGHQNSDDVLREFYSRGDPNYERPEAPPTLR